MPSSIDQIVVGIDRSLEALNSEIATLEATRSVLRGESSTKRTRKASESRENVHTAAVRAAANTVERERKPKRKRSTTKDVSTPRRKASPGQRQEQVLAEIRRSPGISTIRLAPVVGVQRLHAYGLVKRLEADGKIEGSHKEGWRPVTQLRMPPQEKKDES